MSRRELVVCDICKATRDAEERSGVVVQVHTPDGFPSIVGDLCDGCFGKVLTALSASISDNIAGPVVIRRLQKVEP